MSPARARTRASVNLLRPHPTTAANWASGQPSVLSLVYLDELPLAEIAQVLAVPTGTVKSRLFRARKLLRHQFTGESHD